MRRLEDMKNTTRPVACALAALLLAGCSARPLPPWEPPTITPPAVRVAEAPAAPMLLGAYAQKVRSMSAEDLQAEYNKLVLDGSDKARLQAALVLAAPNFAARDEQRAQREADDIAKSTATPAALRDSAALIALWLEETRRNDQDRRRAQTKTREDEARIQLLETRLRDLERRASDAEKKLEALRAIERELSNRANGARPQ